jgi:pyrroline-5-carboxylate reductase
MNSIGIIGLGTLGGAIARGLARVHPGLDILATSRGTSALPSFVTPCADNAELAARTKMILLCVKPQQARNVLGEIAPAVSPDACVLSACAAVPLSALQEALPIERIARVMPNIACEFNEGFTAIAFGDSFDRGSREEVLALFASLGEAIALDERHFDAVTALSGCGPAYVCVITEALSDAGVKAGLPRGVSRAMAVQTLLGSTVLLRNLNEHPAAVRDRVTTPGGCTIDALTQLEEGRLRATLIAAVTAAAAKSAQLGTLLVS